jgi:hypothetical protein
MNTLPAIVEKSVSPKPTKAEIVEALVQLKIQQLEDEKRAKTAARDLLGEQVEKALREYFLANVDSLTLDVRLGYLRTWSGKHNLNEVSINCDLEELPDELSAQLIVYHEAAEAASFTWDEDQIRKAVRERISGASSRQGRIESMLANPETKNALSDLLKSLE